jgi:hypothetical protein
MGELFTHLSCAPWTWRALDFVRTWRASDEVDVAGMGA